MVQMKTLKHSHYKCIEGLLQVMEMWTHWGENEPT